MSKILNLVFSSSESYKIYNQFDNGLRTSDSGGIFLQNWIRALAMQLHDRQETELESLQVEFWEMEPIGRRLSREIGNFVSSFRSSRLQLSAHLIWLLTHRERERERWP